MPERRLQPIALRSKREQRRHALQAYLPRTWVDSVLVYAERATIAAVLLFFSYWLADGPLRDWLHSYQNPVAPAPVVVAAAPTARAARIVGPPARTPAPVLLPYTTIEMAQPPADEFNAPRQAPADIPAAVAPEPTRLQIPAIALDTPVKEVFVVDGAWEVADYAAGYMHGTGLPGTPGNTVLAGHAGLRGAVFRDLGVLVAGDEIYIDAAGQRFRYQVREALSVWPNQVEVLAPTKNATMTLITCTNWDTQRLVVVADLIDSQPAPRP